MIDVKIRDFDEADLRRGVFHCIKYCAVMKAIDVDVRLNASVGPVLVIQANVIGDLKKFISRHNIRYFTIHKELRKCAAAGVCQA